MSCVYVDWLFQQPVNINAWHSASCWFLLYRYITMQGQQNFKFA